MAAGRRPVPRPCPGSHRLFVVAHDSSVLGHLVFNLSLKHLFSQKSQLVVPDGDGDGDGDEDETQAPPLLSLPDPVASLKQLHPLYQIMAFSASPCGNVVAAIGYKGQTLIYDASAAAAVSPGPDMNSYMRQPFFFPVGDRMFFAISAYPRLDDLAGPRQPCRFETLQQRRRTGRWAWTAVPDPPGPAGRVRGSLVAYFVSGARVYVSLRDQGTYSYDTARRRWRMEGAWELPVMGRAVLVPDFLGTGRRLLFGFRHVERTRSNQEFPMCAVDMDARPPVVVACWPGAARFGQAWRTGYNLCPRVSQLNHLGGGRFCVSATSHRMHEDSPDGVVTFMAVELTHDLQLRRGQYSCYLLPQSARRFPADVLDNY